MIPVAILLFLVGAVLAWGFRVWIVVPITLLAMIIAVTVELSHGASLPMAFGIGLLIALTPQLGYAYGLLTRNILLALRYPAGHPRRASVATLYKRSIHQARPDIWHQAD
jgi:hypothetical protein